MLLLLSCCVACCCTCVLLVTIVNVFVAQPYMDEIFHVNQSAEYCSEHYGYWNNKITTPPGLYLVSVGVMKPLLRLLGSDNAVSVCTARTLRYINAVYVGVLFLVVYSSLKKVGIRRQNESTLCLTSVNIILFPLVTFFSLLHYTDTPSLLFVLLMYCLHLHNLHRFAAISGFFACAMRQTNIIWAAFCAGLTLYDIVQEFLQVFDKKQRMRSLKESLVGILKMIKEKPRLFYHMLVTMFSKTAAYMLLLASFCVLALVNGGLALGDKSAHEVVLHMPQLYYLFTFICAMAGPLLLNMYSCSLIRKNKNLIFVAMSCMLFGVAYFTFDHPYLLADNRHYTFYIWKWWFRRGPLYRYLSIPIYAIALVILANSLSLQSNVWKVGFFLCSALACVPNRLLELRYFIIPYVIWRINCRPGAQTKRRILLETFMFVCINIFTISMFLFRPFTWSHEPGVQRFMW